MRPWANCGDWTDIFVERTDIFAANESERLFLRGGCVQTVEVARGDREGSCATVGLPLRWVDR